MIDENSSISAFLAQAVARHRVPGASFALWKNGELSLAAAGLLNAALGTPVTHQSMFQIGSIQKSLTATLVMQLVEAGRMSLDSPVRECIPDFRVADEEASRSVTLRQLLCHTSGLAGDFGPDTGGGPDKLARLVDRCALLPQVHAPGKGFSYSNSGYCIAGRVCEILSGRTFEALLRERIFKPLELTDSSVEPRNIVGKSVAIGHGLEPETGTPVPVAKPYLPQSGVPSGAVTTMSAANLVRFAATHLTSTDVADHIVSRRSADEMQKVQAELPVSARGISHWGLGWFIFRWDRHEMFGHDGATVGQFSFLRIHVPSGTIAVLLTNGGAAQDLMDDVFAEFVAPAMGIDPPPLRQPLQKSAGDLSRYAGTFATVGGETVITAEDSHLVRASWLRLGDHRMEEAAQAMQFAGGRTFLCPRPFAKSKLEVSFLGDQERPSRIFSGLRVSRRIK